MSKRNQHCNKTRTTSAPNPPTRNMAEVFGGTLAGGIPIKASVMNRTPIHFNVSGATEAVATTELMRVVRDEFTRLGVHRHPVSVEMEIGGKTTRKELLVIFDEAYKYSALWPMDRNTARPTGGAVRQCRENSKRLN